MYKYLWLNFRKKTIIKGIFIYGLSWGFGLHHEKQSLPHPLNRRIHDVEEGRVTWRNIGGQTDKVKCLSLRWLKGVSTS
jgi:hypothetical protein